MLAKNLYRNIYMVEASNRIGKANFLMFTAGERDCNGVKFKTMKERIFSPREVKDWIKLLKAEYMEHT